MRRLVVFGNSGSGKTTLARSICESEGLAHFDLDSIAWLPTNPPERTPLQESAKAIDKFISNHSDWVIEGCYADLIGLATPSATEMIFLNLPIVDCVENSKMRSWEPHKYPSKEAQDANLDMLIEWISQYATRKDCCSLSVHTELFEAFEGQKKMISSRP